MKKLFITTWIIVFLTGIFMTVCIHIKPFGRIFTTKRTVDGIRLGRLFYNSKVDYFKEYNKSIGYKETTSVHDADIIAVGDSFLNSGLPTPGFNPT